MKLSTRLAVAVALVLLGTLAALSVVLVRSTRATLVEQVDQDLKANSVAARGWERQKGDGPGSREDRFPGKRQVGTYYCDANGQIDDDRSLRAGYPNDPLPDPDLPSKEEIAAGKVDGRYLTVPSVDGSLTYRVLVNESPQSGELLVSAAPLTAVNAAVRRLMRITAGLFALALVAAVLGSWLLIRRGLRPVDRMVGTTAAIAAGDLSLRVDEPDPRTELGRLGGAINAMLGQIETAYRAREASEDRLRRFVADAAHELRTPLTSLRGYAELYRQGAMAGPDGVDTAMRRIESEGARMARLVDDLLLLARLDQQRGIERRPVELVSLLREAVQDLHAIDPARPVTEDLPAEATVVGDRVRLRQVVDNLLSNARTHTPPGTPIHVRLAAEPGAVAVAVADEGPGIPEADRERIFERFFRVDPSRSRSRGGTGLGLSIVASLVEAHGGTVSVESEVGRGTTFTVRLPVAGPPTPAPSPAQSTDPSTDPGADPASAAPPRTRPASA